jgi:hypothetical protein
MFCGKYKVYLDGQLVAEKENAITKSGRQIMLKNLMGQIDTIGGSIQMGIGSSANGTSSLSSASTSSGTVTYTTRYSHGYSVGDIVTVTGNSISAYNVVGATITLVPSPTTFTISSAGNASSGTGGQVLLVTPVSGLIPDTRLEFSTSQVPVSLSFLDNAGDFDAIVFKGAIPASGSGSEAQKIYELGIFPPGLSEVSSFSQTSLFNGSRSDTWTNGGPLPDRIGSGSPETSSYITPALTSYPFRVGDTALFIKANQTVTTTSGGYSNMTTYGSEDFISVAISKESSSTPTITIKFHVSSGVFYTFTYTGTAGKTYEILNRSISEGVVTSQSGTSPTWNTIRYATISSNADVVIDAVRINDNIEIDPTYGMVSRTVLDTPIVKNSSQSLEIEYYLSLSFNKTVA